MLKRITVPCVLLTAFLLVEQGLAQDVTIKVSEELRFESEAGKSLMGSVNVNPGANLIIESDLTVALKVVLTMDVAGTKTVSEYDLPVGRQIITIAVSSFSSAVIDLLEGESLKDRLSVSATVRRFGPMRLDIAYVYSRSKSAEYFSDSGGNIALSNTGNFEDAAVLMLHFVAPQSVGDFFTAPFRALGFKKDELAFAFSFGLPAPGTETPIEYVAGLSVLFGTDRNLAFTYGLAFANVDRLRSDLMIGGTAPDPIPLTSRTVTGWFFGVSYKIPG